MHDQIIGSGIAEILKEIYPRRHVHIVVMEGIIVALRLSQTSGDPHDNCFILTGTGGLGLQS